MTHCPYCGGITKRITCGAPGCQLSMTDARQSVAEYRAKMQAYRAMPKQPPLCCDFYTLEQAKAITRARYLRRRETAGDVAKLAVILGAWCAAWIIACPDTARAAAMAVPEDSTLIPNAGLLFLALVMTGTMILLAIIAAIDHAKYGAIDRALAARRARLERDNDAYAAAPRRGDWE